MAVVKYPGLRFIAGIKLAKGVLLTGIGLGFFHAINHNLGETTRKIAYHFRIDPENHMFRVILEKTTNIEPRRLRTFGLVSLLFAAELYAEGIGLWLNQSWAKYLLVVATSIFVPDEVRNIIVKFSWERVGILVVNLALLLYVVMSILRRKEKTLAHGVPGV